MKIRRGRKNTGECYIHIEGYGEKNYYGESYDEMVNDILREKIEKKGYTVDYLGNGRKNVIIRIIDTSLEIAIERPENLTWLNSSKETLQNYFQEIEEKFDAWVKTIEYTEEFEV